MTAETFTFEYRPATIHHGPGVVAVLGATLRRHECSRALVVTGSTVAGTPEVVEPVREGIGDALVGVFDGVTPEKYLKTAVDAARRVSDEDVDALVSLGGGSSLDVAKIVSVLVGHDRPLEAVVGDVVEHETMLLPAEDRRLLPIFAIPTTLPGADLSQIAGVKLSMDPGKAPKSGVPSGGVSDARLMPEAVFYDPDLVATTPPSILARSAMNGYDKGIEMLYTRHHTPITDAAAMRGLRLLQSSLPAVTRGASRDDVSRILQGIALAQYGVSTPNAYRASIVHAFGHALSRNYDVQQGVAHAIAAPHVLRYLFEHVDCRRDLLAEALDVADESADDEATAEAVVDAVEGTRDALELPSRLRTVDGAERHHFPDLATAVIEDPFMDAAPRGLSLEPEEIEAVFEAMW